MLTVKQKVKLRSMAMTLKPIYQVGKEEISDNLIKGLDLALEAHELIKFRLLQTVSSPVREIALDVASNTNSVIVQIVGKVITLYRPSKNKIYKI